MQCLKYDYSLKDIQEEFGLRRRRTAQVLVESALTKFKSRLAILRLIDLVAVDPKNITDDESEFVAGVLAGLRKHNRLDAFLRQSLEVEYGT